MHTHASKTQCRHARADAHLNLCTALAWYTNTWDAPTFGTTSGSRPVHAPVSVSDDSQERGKGSLWHCWTHWRVVKGETLAVMLARITSRHRLGEARPAGRDTGQKTAFVARKKHMLRQIWWVGMAAVCGCGWQGAGDALFEVLTTDTALPMRGPRSTTSVILSRCSLETGVGHQNLYHSRITCVPTRLDSMQSPGTQSVTLGPLRSTEYAGAASAPSSKRMWPHPWVSGSVSASSHVARSAGSNGAMRGRMEGCGLTPASATIWKASRSRESSVW